MFEEFINQNLLWFGALALISVLLILSYLQGAVAGVKTVSVLEMPMLQRKGKSALIDVNKAEHFAAEHIPNSLNIPLEDINADNTALLKHKDKTTIVVCQTGSRSTKAAKLLTGLGFTNVNVLNGGLVSWTKENLPVTRINNS